MSKAQIILNGRRRTYEIDLDLNPEPWAVGPMSVGRKGSQLYPIMGRNQQLWNYQQAVKEEVNNLLDSKLDLVIEGAVEIQVWFWRQLEPYKTEKARAAAKHHADGTNMLKAIEDALQGLLYDNDRYNVVGRWEIMEQTETTEPRIFVRVIEK